MLDCKSVDFKCKNNKKIQQKAYFYIFVQLLYVPICHTLNETLTDGENQFSK